MRIKLLLCGKTSPTYLQEGTSIYEKRLGHYAAFEIKYLPDSKLNKSMSVSQMKTAESEIFLKAVAPEDFLVLLDENGKQLTSLEFSAFISKHRDGSKNELVFAIGGAHGFDEILKGRSNMLVSLSKLTFPHQLARLIFLEQLYRAFTIIKKEPYHHI